VEKENGDIERLLTLKEMTRGTGNTPRTVRFYEEEGLIQSARRSPAGHRMFEAGELEKLGLISDLRKAGFTIQEIKQVFAMRGAGGDLRGSAGEVSRFLNHRIGELRRLLASMVRLKEEFSQSVDVLTSACVNCAEPTGREMCVTCPQIDHANLPRTFRWIWSVH
jgi:DNA-binding transcriptional MerR regulator